MEFSKLLFFDTDDYEITARELGRGTFGIVFVAKRKIDGKEFAAKIILSKIGTFNGEDQYKFLRESQVLSTLNHPAIVKFHGINFHSFNEKEKDKLQPTLLTEYLPRGSLEDILEEERKNGATEDWNATKKYILLLGITHAMRYLHENNIIHRDLKPQNILMDSNFYPRVCDFGLSRFLPKNNSNWKLTSKGVGTPKYMAPELFEGNEEYGFSVDVYSFAILAYEIVTGKDSLEDSLEDSFYTHCKKVLNGVRPKFDGCKVTDKMQNLIEKCWSTDEKERPTFGEIFDLLSQNIGEYSYEDLDQKEVNDYLKVLEKQRQNFFAINEVPSTLSDMIFDTSNLKIEKKLGSGIQSTYYKAICPPLNGKNETSCTLKVYHKKPNIEDQKSLLESIECQSILRHESIQSLIGFSLPTETDDHYKVVTPLHVNGSLADLISAVAEGKAPRNWETIKAISIFGIAAGMASMHQHRIVLGDLRPESVFFDQDFHPKIGGFANAVSIKNGKKRNVPQKLLNAIAVYKAP